MSSEPLHLALGGLSIIYEPISDSNRESLRAGSYYELDWISEVLRGFVRSGDVAVDAGANTGLWSLPLAMHVGTAGHLYAFEPEPTAYNALVRNANLNAITNITAFPMALASRTVQRTLYVRPDTEMHSFFQTTVRPFEHVLAHPIDVKAVRLDELVLTGVVQQPKFIKIDVEGAELEVLEGLSGISQQIDTILVEIHHEPLASQGNDETLIRKLLNDYGFSIVRRLGSIHLLASRD